MNTEDLKSLAKIAEELQITRQAIYKRVNSSTEIQEQLKQYTVNNGSRVYYTPQGQELIKRLFVFKYQPNETIDNQCKQNVNQCETIKTAENSGNNNIECEPMATNKNQCKQNVKQSEPEETAPHEGAAASPLHDLQTAAIIDTLTEQLKNKDRQLEEYAATLKAAQEQQQTLAEALKAAQEQNNELTLTLKETTEKLTTALTQQQALHAGTLQQQLTSTATGEPLPHDLTEEPHPESEKVLHKSLGDLTDTQSGTEPPPSLLQKIKRIFKKGV